MSTGIRRSDISSFVRDGEHWNLGVYLEWVDGSHIASFERF